MDAIVLNLQRACEMATDVAMYIVSTRKLGIPQTKKEAFEKLNENKLISDDMCAKMKGLIGFRNIVIHEYKEIDDEILKDIIEHHLVDIKEFARIMINLER